MADRIKASIEGDEELLKKLRALGAGVSQVLEQAVLKGDEVIIDGANQKAPGPHVKAEITFKSQSKVESAIGPDKEHWYYQFFETGAGPHEITPDVAGALAFPGSEEAVVRTRVSHTGFGAQPFLRNTMDERKDQAVDAVGSEFKKEIDKQVEN